MKRASINLAYRHRHFAGVTRALLGTLCVLICLGAIGGVSYIAIHRNQLKKYQIHIPRNLGGGTSASAVNTDPPVVVEGPDTTGRFGKGTVVQNPLPIASANPGPDAPPATPSPTHTPHQTARRNKPPKPQPTNDSKPKGDGDGNHTVVSFFGLKDRESDLDPNHQNQ